MRGIVGPLYRNGGRHAILGALPLMTQPDADREKRQDVAHAARSGGMQALTVGAQALVSITHVLLARLFGRAVFGSYQACLAILELVTRGSSAGANGGILRYVAGARASGQHDQVRSAIGAGLRLCLTMATLAVLVLVAAAGPLARLMRQPALETGLRIIAPAAIIAGCTGVIVQASLAAKVTRANFYVKGLGEPAILLAAGLTAALFGRSLATLASAHLVATTATLLLAIVAVGRVFGPGELRRSVASPPLPGFVKFSLPLGAGDLLNAIMQRTDIILLTVFVGTSATAVYAAAEFLTRVISSARSVFDSVAAPVFSEAMHLGQHDRLKQNLIMMNRWVVSVAAPVALTVVVIRRDLLALYGPGFREGATALAILASSHLVNVSCGLIGWILLAGGRSRTLLINNAVAAPFNIVLGLILIPRFGLVGTALAVLGSVVLINGMAILEVWLGYRVFLFDRTIWKPIVAAAVIFGVESVINRLVGPAGLRIPVLIVAGLASYLGMLLALGLAPEERRLLASARERLRARRA
jgi:O-antigen/teichoic acid export membrane protein